MCIHKQLGSKRRVGSGRKPKIMDIKGKRKLKVMFDQSVNSSSSNGNSKFYTSNIRLAPEDVKYTQKKKMFEDHIMLWFFFSKKVCSTLFFE